MPIGHGSDGSAEVLFSSLNVFSAALAPWLGYCLSTVLLLLDKKDASGDAVAK